jgi:hypothetical protein
MKKILITSSLFLTFLAVSTNSAFALEKTDGFVCPVFNDNSAVGEHNPNAVPIANGDYTIAGPNVSVPLHATNDDGEGSPGGNHVGPNDTTYSAIWAGN